MIYLGSDHAGFQLKEAVKNMLEEKGIEYTDMGTHSEEAVDFPDYAFPVSEKVAQSWEAGTNDFGILVCGSGIGMNIAANKVTGVRAALAMNEYMARQSREHNNANVLVLAGRILSTEEGLTIAESFLSEEKQGEDRHHRRVDKITTYEDNK